jgi:hypothetical protein
MGVIMAIATRRKFIKIAAFTGVGIGAVVLMRKVLEGNSQSLSIRSTLDYKICTGMFWSGVKTTGTITTTVRPLMEVPGKVAIDPRGCCAVVGGVTILGTAVVLLAATATRITGTTSLVVAWLCRRRGSFSLAVETAATQSKSAFVDFKKRDNSTRFGIAIGNY